MRPCSSNASPQVLLFRTPQELQLRHGQALGVGPQLEAVVPLLEADALAVDGAVEAGVAHTPVDPVVEAVTQVTRPGVGVVGGPAGEQDLPHVGDAVAVGVLEEQGVRGLVDDDAAVNAQQARRDRQLVGEHGELVRPAIPVGVFQNHNLVAAVALLLQLVGVVHRDGGPEPAALVPGRGDRFAALEVRVGGEEFEPEPLGHGVVRQRLLGRERLLHRRDRLGQGAPGFARRVERHLGGHLLEVGRRRGDRRHLRGVDVGAGEGGVLAAGPAGAAFEEVVEAGVAPGALVVAPGGVEDAALAFVTHPRPRLLQVAVGADFEDRAAGGVVLVVDVGLVPALEAREAGRHRVFGDFARPEHAGRVGAELRPDELDVVVVVGEAEARAMDRDEALAGRDEGLDRLHLLRGAAVDVGEDHQPVVRLQPLGRQHVGLVGVGQRDVAGGEHRLQLPEPRQRQVVPGVAEEQHLQGRRLGGRGLSPRGRGGRAVRGGVAWGALPGKMSAGGWECVVGVEVETAPPWPPL